VADRDPRGHESLPDAVSVNVGLDADAASAPLFSTIESMC
jgi:hypothetical protein